MTNDKAAEVGIRSYDGLRSDFRLTIMEWCIANEIDRAISAQWLIELGHDNLRAENTRKIRKLDREYGSAPCTLRHENLNSRAEKD